MIPVAFKERPHAISSKFQNDGLGIAEIFTNQGYPLFIRELVRMSQFLFNPQFLPLKASFSYKIENDGNQNQKRKAQKDVHHYLSVSKSGSKSGSKNGSKSGSKNGNK